MEEGSVLSMPACLNSMQSVRQEGLSGMPGITKAVNPCNFGLNNFWHYFLCLTRCEAVMAELTKVEGDIWV